MTLECIFLHLNEKYLPIYHFSEKHALNISATQADVMAAVRDYQPGEDPFFRCAIILRELPIRILDRMQRRTGMPRQPFGMDNFTLLEQRDNQELAFGLAGRFWKSDYGQEKVIDAEAFLAFSAPSAAKLVLSFTAEKLDETHTQLTTETRVLCLDKEARRKLAPYWYLIRPVSGLIRLRMLSAIRRSAGNRTHNTSI